MSACLPLAPGGSCPDWIGSPGPREPPRGPPVGAGSAGTLTASFPLGPYEPWPAVCGPGGVGWFAVCVFTVQPALALGGAQKPARARAFSGRGAASGGRAGQGRGARPPASPQLSLSSASPGVGAVPTMGAPGSLPPPAWEEQTQSFTLPHTEGCLFFICRGIVASILVFLCFGVTQAKDGPFSRPHPGNLPFLSPCVPSGGAVLRLESVCAAACEWPAPPQPPGLQTSARRAGETGFTGARKPLFSPNSGPSCPAAAHPVLVREVCLGAEGPWGCAGRSAWPLTGGSAFRCRAPCPSRCGGGPWEPSAAGSPVSTVPPPSQGRAF